MIEGERSFDITLRYPRGLRSNLDAILDIPVEVGKNTVVNSQANGQGNTPVSGPTKGPSPTGSSAALPPLTGSSSNAPMNDLSRTPRRPLGDLVTPLGPDGRLDEHGSFLRRGALDTACSAASRPAKKLPTGAMSSDRPLSAHWGRRLLVCWSSEFMDWRRR